MLSADQPATSADSAPPSAALPAQAPRDQRPGHDHNLRSQKQKGKRPTTPRSDPRPGKPSSADLEEMTQAMSAKLGKALRDKAELQAQLVWAKTQFDEEACRRAHAERLSLQDSLNTETK